MDIWNKVINLLFLIALMATVTSALSAVITEPPQRTVEAPLGSSLILICSFEPQTSAWVRWYFNINQSCSDSSSSQLSSHKISINKTVEQNDGGHVLQESGRAWSRLTVRDVRYNDSGWYFCQVLADIPYLRNSNSNETQVIITGKTTESTPPLMTVTRSTHSNEGLLLGWKLWVAVGAASAILVSLLVVIWILLQRRRSIIQRGLQMDKQKISPTLKYIRTPTPARTHDNKHIRIPTPARIHDNKHIRIPIPRRANDNKHLTEISTPPRALNNKPLTETPNPPRAHDGKHLPTPARAHDLRTPTPSRAHDSK
ncbi:uncharacterized protein LOC109897479 isoform X2 [Oncorhynchus kisutch]|uniref:uncharacterized protein LOC109897479 isoform X2 n=1 Tax=Oncorhynchus kisutch TaxID=8019 RepID=UPI0012DD4281|nr:uncharacterized protein LOC109897479 isoform X2 [Oncorhynchus kisutch]